MQMSKIKTGMVVETTHGIGVVVRAGGTHPPSVKVDIKKPFPRGVLNLVPKDVIREIELTREEKQDAHAKRLAWQKVLAAARSYADAAARHSTEDSMPALTDLAAADRALEDAALAWSKS